ncbi:MAG: hypothetical protein J2O49_05780 [Sciscionella sp.]|nr:hypothetical protein [Sciscionella sp.]
MSLPWPFGNRTPWGEIDALLRSTALTPVAPTPAGVVQAIVRAAGDQLIGRRMTVRSDDTDVELTLVELTTKFDSLAMARGQFGDVRVVGDDVRLPGLTATRVVLDGRNVRLASPTSVTLLATPVEVEVTVPMSQVREWVREYNPAVVVDGVGDGLAAVRWARRPDWGYLEVTPSLIDRDTRADIRLQPRALVIGGRRITSVKRLLPITIELPELPRGLRLRNIECRRDELVFRAVANSWRERLTIGQLVDLLWRISTAATSFVIPSVEWKTESNGEAHGVDSTGDNADNVVDNDGIEIDRTEIDRTEIDGVD